MLSRAAALLFIPILPFAPLLAPFGAAHATSVIVAGIVATMLAVLSFADDRARVAAAVVGVAVAFSSFVFDATFEGAVLTMAWGINTLVFMVGPFSAAPESRRLAAVVPLVTTAERPARLAA